MLYSDMTWTIYCHIHEASGRRYVGLTKHSMTKRWNRHVYNALHSRGNTRYFPNAIRKYGPNAFSHEILEVCHYLEVANMAEECWIEFYETRDPTKGFNLAKGGSHVTGDSQIVSISQRMKRLWENPIYRSNISSKIAASNRTRIVSLETRQRIGASIASLFETRTHINCKVHGLVSIVDGCYKLKYKSANGIRYRYDCKECRKEYNRSWKQSGRSEEMNG